MREFGEITWAEHTRNKTIQDVIDGNKKLDEKTSNLADLFATIGTYPDTVHSRLNEKLTEIEMNHRKKHKMPPFDVDNVNSPKHYNQGGVECIDAITAATTNKTGIEAVCTANIIKYLWRYEYKNGLEDVKKAQWYLNKLIGRLENE